MTTEQAPPLQQDDSQELGGFYYELHGGHLKSVPASAFADYTQFALWSQQKQDQESLVKHLTNDMRRLMDEWELATGHFSSIKDEGESTIKEQIQLQVQLAAFFVLRSLPNKVFPKIKLNYDDNILMDDGDISSTEAPVIDPGLIQDYISRKLYAILGTILSRNEAEARRVLPKYQEGNIDDTIANYVELFERIILFRNMTSENFFLAKEAADLLVLSEQQQRGEPEGPTSQETSTIEANITKAKLDKDAFALYKKTSKVHEHVIKLLINMKDIFDDMDNDSIAKVISDVGPVRKMMGQKSLAERIILMDEMATEEGERGALLTGDKVAMTREEDDDNVELVYPGSSVDMHFWFNNEYAAFHQNNIIEFAEVANVSVVNIGEAEEAEDIDEEDDELADDGTWNPNADVNVFLDSSRSSILASVEPVLPFTKFRDILRGAKLEAGAQKDLPEDRVNEIYERVKHIREPETIKTLLVGVLEDVFEEERGGNSANYVPEEGDQGDDMDEDEEDEDEPDEEDDLMTDGDESAIRTRIRDLLAEYTIEFPIFDPKRARIDFNKATTLYEIDKKKEEEDEEKQRAIQKQTEEDESPHRAGNNGESNEEENVVTEDGGDEPMTADGDSEHHQQQSSQQATLREPSSSQQDSPGETDVMQGVENTAPSSSDVTSLSPSTSPPSGDDNVNSTGNENPPYAPPSELVNFVSSASTKLPFKMFFTPKRATRIRRYINDYSTKVLGVEADATDLVTEEDDDDEDDVNSKKQQRQHTEKENKKTKMLVDDILSGKKPSGQDYPITINRGSAHVIPFGHNIVTFLAEENFHNPENNNKYKSRYEEIVRVTLTDPFVLEQVVLYDLRRRTKFETRVTKCLDVLRRYLDDANYENLFKEKKHEILGFFNDVMNFARSNTEDLFYEEFIRSYDDAMKQQNEAPVTSTTDEQTTISESNTVAMESEDAMDVINKEDEDTEESIGMRFLVTEKIKKRMKEMRYTERGPVSFMDYVDYTIAMRNSRKSVSTKTKEVEESMVAAIRNEMRLLRKIAHFKHMQLTTDYTPERDVLRYIRMYQEDNTYLEDRNKECGVAGIIDENAERQNEFLTDKFLRFPGRKTKVSEVIRKAEEIIAKRERARAELYESIKKGKKEDFAYKSFVYGPLPFWIASLKTTNIFIPSVLLRAWESTVKYKMNTAAVQIIRPSMSSKMDKDTKNRFEQALKSRIPTEIAKEVVRLLDKRMEESSPNKKSKKLDDVNDRFEHAVKMLRQELRAVNGTRENKLYQLEENKITTKTLTIRNVYEIARDYLKKMATDTKFDPSKDAFIVAVNELIKSTRRAAEDYVIDNFVRDEFANLDPEYSDDEDDGEDNGEDIPMAYPIPQATYFAEDSSLHVLRRVRKALGFYFTVVCSASPSLDTFLSAVRDSVYYGDNDAPFKDTDDALVYVTKLAFGKKFSKETQDKVNEVFKTHMLEERSKIKTFNADDKSASVSANAATKILAPDEKRTRSGPTGGPFAATKEALSTAAKLYNETLKALKEALGKTDPSANVELEDIKKNVGNKKVKAALAKLETIENTIVSATSGGAYLGAKTIVRVAVLAILKVHEIIAGEKGKMEAKEAMNLIEAAEKRIREKLVAMHNAENTVLRRAGFSEKTVGKKKTMTSEEKKRASRKARKGAKSDSDKGKSEAKDDNSDDEEEEKDRDFQATGDEDDDEDDEDTDDDEDDNEPSSKKSGSKNKKAASTAKKTSKKQQLSASDLLSRLKDDGDSLKQFTKHTMPIVKLTHDPRFKLHKQMLEKRLKFVDVFDEDIAVKIPKEWTNEAADEQKAAMRLVNRPQAAHIYVMRLLLAGYRVIAQNVKDELGSTKDINKRWAEVKNYIMESGETLRGITVKAIKFAEDVIKREEGKREKNASTSQSKKRKRGDDGEDDDNDGEPSSAQHPSKRIKTSDPNTTTGRARASGPVRKRGDDD